MLVHRHGAHITHTTDKFGNFPHIIAMCITWGTAGAKGMGLWVSAGGDGIRRGDAD